MLAALALPFCAVSLAASLRHESHCNCVSASNIALLANLKVLRDYSIFDHQSSQDLFYEWWLYSKLFNIFFKFSKTQHMHRVLFLVSTNAWPSMCDVRWRVSGSLLPFLPSVSAWAFSWLLFINILSSSLEVWVRISYLPCISHPSVLLDLIYNNVVTSCLPVSFLSVIRFWSLSFWTFCSKPCFRIFFLCCYLWYFSSFFILIY